LFGFLIAWLDPGLSSSRAIIFIFLAALLYIRPIFNGLAILRSFAVLLLLSIFIPESLYGFKLFPVIHGLLFFLILGLKEFVLVHRVFWHEALFAVLAYETLLLHSIFYSQYPLLSSLAAVFIFSALLSELISREAVAEPRRIWLASGVLSLLALSGLWIGRVLPLGFWNTANLVALGMLFFVEMLLRFYNGKLTRAMVVSRVIVVMLLLALIFLTSRWYL
jgi:hypothetical protein